MSTVSEAWQIYLNSQQGRSYDVWALMNMPIPIGGRTLKLADFATVSHRDAPKSIAKENQQYRLCLQYEYIGSSTQGKKILENDLERLSRKLPIGYSAKTEGWDYYWNRDQEASYWLLLLVIAIIFFTTSILFNSLMQPLAIIFTIPISFIGVFVTFYLTKINFDREASPRSYCFAASRSTPQYTSLTNTTHCANDIRAGRHSASI